VKPGETILGFDLGNHLFFVLSVEVAGLVAVANFTDSSFPSSDRTCVAHPGEHPFLTKESCVYYRKAEMVALAPLSRAREEGELKQHQPLSPALLRRIQDGALISRFTARDVQAAVRLTLEVSEGR